MSGSTGRLQALWTLDPPRAAAEVRSAMAQATTLNDAAALLGVSPRTLYRWILRSELTVSKGSLKMKPRELRGAINRAKYVYALCPYSTTRTYHIKVSKEAARELADIAVEEKQEIIAEEDSGDLYIGALMAGATAPADSEEEEDDDE